MRCPVIGRNKVSIKNALVTKKNIQQHGGIIEIDSELKVGSTFRIILPKNRLPRISNKNMYVKRLIKGAKKISINR